MPVRRRKTAKRTRNPSIYGEWTDAAVRRRVMEEAHSAPEHYAMAIEHWKYARKMGGLDPALADFHWRMGDTHRDVAGALMDLERVTTARKRGFRR